ncbi:WD40-repeat-containing domain protein [Scenedesmus sp. NREL 46B-D3]|nr:WD40-repeat-containing domain protein [Scenedesmus sp. NREL 46B-D3]
MPQNTVTEVPDGPKWADAAVVQTWGEASKDQGATCLACSACSLEPGTAALVAVGRKGRRVEVLDAATGAQQASLTAAAPDKPVGGAAAASTVQLAAVGFVQPDGDSPLQLVAATSDGMVSVCSCSEDGSGWAVSRSFRAGPSITCMAISSSGCHLLLGGEGVQPSIWDLAAGSKLWQAKGGKPHRQTLLVDKPFTTAIAFLPGGSSSSCDSSAETATAAAALEDAGEAAAAAAAAVKLRFVAGSASSKVHVYDTAAGRRPQQQVVFGETRVTALAPQQDGMRVWAANGTGHMQVLDMRSNKMEDALKGAGGSVRALALHPGGQPLVASAGLDRFLRVHSTATKAGSCRIYLKQQLTAICWLPVQQVAPAPADAAAAAAGAAAAEQHAGEAAAARGVTPHKKKKSSKMGKREAAAGEEPLPGLSRKKRQKA